MASGAQKTPERVMTMQGDAPPHPSDPSVMKGVIPYLYLGGNTAKAIDFYKTAFGAKDLGQMPWKDEKTGAEGIMHGQVEINGGALMLSDFHPHLQSFTPPPGEPSTDSRCPAWSRSSPKILHRRACAANARRSVRARSG